MKKIQILFIAVFVILMAFSSCKTVKPSDNELNSDNIVPQPHSVQLSDETQTSNSDFSGEPTLKVTDSVAYIFPNLEGNELYAACEFVNDSNCPCYVKSVEYTLNISGKDKTISAEQPANTNCAIYPGESFYNAAWTAYDCLESDTVSVTDVTVKCEKSNAINTEIKISELYMVQNYPSFATVSGMMEQNSSTVTLNEVYLGFYNSSNKLIGVWYFTDASELAPGQKKHFTTHLKSLQIEGLCNETAKITAKGFGLSRRES